MFDFVLTRLREPSTYAGLAGIAAAFGVAAPLYQAISAVVMAVAGLVAVLMAEQAK